MLSLLSLFLMMLSDKPKTEFFHGSSFDFFFFFFFNKIIKQVSSVLGFFFFFFYHLFSFFFFFRKFQPMTFALNDNSFIIKPKHQSVFGIGRY